MSATTRQVSEGVPLPAGLVVEGSPTMIARVFSELCPLQPIRMERWGLVCAPRSAPELAARALARCALPVRLLDYVPGWPGPPAAMVAGWYRRSPSHMPAPHGIRELIQAPGEAFGPGDHATTSMCLEQIELMPDGPAIDAGCGSGLLAQAWVALDKGDVLGCDLDPRAIAQTEESLRASGHLTRVTVRRGAIEAIDDADLRGRVLIANIPLAAHQSLLTRLTIPPPGVVLSGLRPPQADLIAASYRALGLRVLRQEQRGGFASISMVRE